MRDRATSGQPQPLALRAAGFAALASLVVAGASGQHTATTTSPVAAGSHPMATRPSGRPAGGSSTAGARRSRSGTTTAHPNVLGPNSGAPRPTWELPKNTTPSWEIPSYNNVQPNQVQGNPRVRTRQVYGVGGVGYVGIPVYADGPNSGNADGENDAAQAPQPGQQRPEYAPGQEGQEDWGPAGPPPDVAQRAVQERPRQLTPAEAAAAQSNGLDHPEVTLVFNDGRPSKKIRSYALTSSSVFVSENGRQTQIPVAELDLAATIAQNREAGVEFALPQSSQ